MYTKDNILVLIDEDLKKRELFLVDVLVRPGNHILVEIDGIKGLSIEDCITISRKIESGLDREKEDFNLEVSSPGAGKPFKVREQFNKNLNKRIEINTVEGQKYTGVLNEVNSNGITMESEQEVKIGDKKKKQVQHIKIDVNFENIETARGLISFK